MALEQPEASVASDGNLRIAFVPSGNAKSVAVLEAETTKKITYSLTPSGYNRAVTENSIDDPRLTLKVTLSRPGTSTQTLELQYVFGGGDEVARPALAEGTSGTLVVRYSVPNETEWAAAQIVDTIPVLAGKQRKDPPTQNGIQTITQSFYMTGIPEDDVALVA